MKKLVLLAIALGSVAVACAPPTTITITPSGGSDNDGGEGGSSSDGGFGGAPVGGGGQGGDPYVAPTAHDVYVDEVHPSLIATCGGCHNPDGQVGAPAFLDYDAELSYSMSKSYPNIVKDPAESSSLITKGPHSGPGTSVTQNELIIKWVSMELAEAGGGGSTTTTTTTTTTGGGGGQTLEQMLESFAACMDYDLWVAKGMDKFPLQQTNGEGACSSCHNAGAGAVWLSADPLETFEKNKAFPYVMRLVTPIYEGSTPVDLAQSNRFINKGIEPCANPPICHPKYTLSAENKAAFEDFVGATLQKWQAGACGQP